MKKIMLWMLLCSIGMSVEAGNNYVTDSYGDIYKNRFSECWRGSAWRESDGIKECECLTDEDFETRELCKTDTDGDGVYDDDDECPDTPEGASVDAKGCELDSDGDGVKDSKDDCPNTPAGTAVDARGCPLAVEGDSDGDGVLDNADNCPNTPAGVAVDAVGCSNCQKADPSIRWDKNCENILQITVENVFFDFDSSELKAGFENRLNSALPHIIGNAAIKRIVVTGHTDSMGSEAYNQKLSIQRAETVKHFAIQKGVKADLIYVEGKGESAPVADNSTEEGRERNRRVEIDIQY